MISQNNRLSVAGRSALLVLTLLLCACSPSTPTATPSSSGAPQPATQSTASTEGAQQPAVQSTASTEGAQQPAVQSTVSTEGAQQPAVQSIGGGPQPAIQKSFISIASVAMSPAASAVVGTGQNIEFTVTWNEPVTVLHGVGPAGAGTPYLPFKIGTADRNARYHQGSGSTSLIFRYPVQATDVLLPQGIVLLAAENIVLDGGSITDPHDRAALLTLPAFPGGQLAGGQVDTRREIQVQALTINPAQGSKVNGRGAAISMTLTFSEPIRVTGKPGLPFMVANEPFSAIYQSGSGTTTLIFRVSTAELPEGVIEIMPASRIILGAGASTLDATGAPLSLLLGAYTGAEIYNGN